MPRPAWDSAGFRSYRATFAPVPTVESYAGGPVKSKRKSQKNRPEAEGVYVRAPLARHQFVSNEGSLVGGFAEALASGRGGRRGRHHNLWREILYKIFDG
jgi:hypothetical protein